MSAWPPLEPLSVGEFAPTFAAPTRTNPLFHFNTLAGRYVLLAFLPRDPGRRAAALQVFAAIRPRFDDRDSTAFFVVREAVGAAIPPDEIPGVRWFFDADGAVARLYGALDDQGGEQPFWLLLDPMLRVLGRAPLATPQSLFAMISALPPAGAQSEPSLTAPVLIAPRVFDNSLCQRLIAHYDAKGGELSGVMRDVDGKTVGVLDPMKSRRDVRLEDQPELRREILGRLERALIPMITRAFQFRATRLERYVVACYDAAEGGYFRPHRDNEAFGTAHRRFAVSINLNAEDFEGGDLRFPEFGSRTYRPPTGGAVVFCCSLLHEATPVTRGRRYAFLPFLYDEDGHRIRQENLSRFPGHNDAEPEPDRQAQVPTGGTD